jgi:hypothetical protein
LTAKEKNGERYLFEVNGIDWLVPSAPLRGLNDVQAVVNGRPSLKEPAQMSGKDWLKA